MIMGKLEVFKQAEKDHAFASDMVKALSSKLSFYKCVSVNSSVTIDSSSSKKQFVYAIGILNNQIKACEELGIDAKEYQDSKETILQIHALTVELLEWNAYAYHLVLYKNDVKALLDKDELFSLLEAPVHAQNKKEH